MRDINLSHATEQGPTPHWVVMKGMANKECVLEVKFEKDAKNKTHHFYKQYHELMADFFTYYEATHLNSSFS